MALSQNVFGPNTGVSIASRKSGAAEALAEQGRRGDTSVIHASPFTRNLLKAMGGAGTINPSTGMMEFYVDFSNVGGVANTDVGYDSYSNLYDSGYFVGEEEADSYYSDLGEYSSIVKNMYDAAGRGTTVDKEGAEYWNDRVTNAVNGGESMSDVLKAFAVGASHIDESRDSLIEQLNSDTYSDFYNQFDIDAKQLASELGQVESTAGTIDTAAKKMSALIDTYGDNEAYQGKLINQMLKDANDAGDVNGNIWWDNDKAYIENLTGVDSNEFAGYLSEDAERTLDQDSLDAAAQAVNDSIANLVETDERYAGAFTDMINGMSDADLLTLTSQAVNANDSEQLLSSSLYADDQQNADGSSWLKGALLDNYALQAITDTDLQNSGSTVDNGDGTITTTNGDGSVTVTNTDTGETTTTDTEGNVTEGTVGNLTAEELITLLENSGVLDVNTDTDTVTETVDNGSGNDSGDVSTATSGITQQQYDDLLAAFKSATGSQTSGDGMTAAEILKELATMNNTAAYDPMAFLNAFGFSFNPTQIGQLIPTAQNLNGTYQLRRVKDRETGEWTTIRVPINVQATNNTARQQRRAGFGSVLAV